jgi:hypothetical protein
MRSRSSAFGIFLLIFIIILGGLAVFLHAFKPESFENLNLIKTEGLG